jgi:AraC-like DNA-binding protein
MNTFYEENGVRIWEGIKKATEEKGYNLICFESKINIREVAYSSGFVSKSTFYKMFKKYTL